MRFGEHWKVFFLLLSRLLVLEYAARKFWMEVYIEKVSDEMCVTTLHNHTSTRTRKFKQWTNMYFHNDQTTSIMADTYKTIFTTLCKVLNEYFFET